MNVWKTEKWKQRSDLQKAALRGGLRLRFDPKISPQVRMSLLKYVKWLRREYVFPLRVRIYVKAVPILHCMDGDTAYTTCFLPFNHYEEPHIRIAAGDYERLKSRWGEERALIQYLLDLTYELTHYFQWLNELNLTEIGEKRQARYCANEILNDYLDCNGLFPDT